MPKQKQKLTRQQEIKQEEEYVAFLEKRLASKNYKSNVSEEEYNKTKAKLEKARLKLRLLNSQF